MADPNHLAILSQGVAAWNEWRKAHPSVQPDFRSAHLRRADLRSADLRDARLIGAYCFGADLRDADLTGANLIGVDLGAADLRGANLCFANLSGADLSDACLWGVQREHWLLQGVICDAIYWDKDREQRTTYAPGEFERLFFDMTDFMAC